MVKHHASGTFSFDSTPVALPLIIRVIKTNSFPNSIRRLFSRREQASSSSNFVLVSTFNHFVKNATWRRAKYVDPCLRVNDGGSRRNLYNFPAVELENQRGLKPNQKGEPLLIKMSCAYSPRVKFCANGPSKVRSFLRFLVC